MTLIPFGGPVGEEPPRPLDPDRKDRESLVDPFEMPPGGGLAEKALPTLERGGFIGSPHRAL